MKIAGWVQQVIHHKGDFCVFRLQDDVTKEIIPAKGNLFGLLQICAGVPIEIVGSWRTHPKYGKQFSVKSWEPWAKEPDDVRLFLYNCVSGFTSQEIAKGVSVLGCSAYDLLSEGFEAVRARLGDLGNCDALQGAILGWQQALATRDLSEFLRDGGLGSAEIQTALAKFGNEVSSIVRENPYRLMEVLPDFPKIDKLAMRFGYDSDNLHRLSGAILWALREEAQQGHLYLQRGEISNVLERLFKQNTLIALPNIDLEGALQELISHRVLVLEPGTGVYLPSYYNYERESAKLLLGLMAPSRINVDFKRFIESYEKGNRISLSESQQAAVESLTQHKVLVLTGLPGTGKTTAIRVLVRLFEEAQQSFALMAPTGIAAKRLASVTGKEASTIHRALGYDGDTWRRNESNRYIVDAVIVDECSMVDQELFYRLLSALRPETMLVLVGDDAQLPSVGPGNVLREIVASRLPHVRLTQIFRQSEKGEIVINSHRINRGEMPSLSGVRDTSEMKFVRISDEDQIVDLLVDMAAKLKSKDANFQVLSPKYGGVVGVNNLNERLRDRLNPPGPREWKQGNCHFRLGDRLMVVQNDYKLGVYNGDMGKLISVGSVTLTVRIHSIGVDDPDMLVEFPFGVAVSRLKLAYAISIHKSQGNEFDTVILPVVRSQGRMLQRNLLYTAMTRARKRVWLLGEEDAIRRAVENNLVIRRNTVLATVLGVE